MVRSNDFCSLYSDKLSIYKKNLDNFICNKEVDWPKTDCFILKEWEDIQAYI